MKLSTRWAALRPLSVLLLTAALAGAAPVRADELVVRRPMDRRFPQGQFCPLPVDIAFTSPGTSVRVVFEARVFVFDPNAQVYVWTDQAIDNVALAPSAVHAANFGPPVGFSSAENCYIGLNGIETRSYFHFNGLEATLPLMEQFDTDPAARGWDLSNGAYFDGGRTEARNVDDGTGFTGGSIGLGLDSPSPDGTEVASTEITINNLTPGENYDLSAWWFVHYVIFNNPDAMLTISVFGPEPTPVAKKSWGAVKRDYR